MSTSAYLNIKIDDYVIVNRVNWDAYPSHLLKELNEHFNSLDSAISLVDGQEIRSIENGNVDRYDDDDSFPLKHHTCKKSEEYNYEFDLNQNKWVIIKHKAYID